MLECLESIDSTIEDRYKTVVQNIKDKNDSFYDAYLDLLETTIKRILEQQNIEFDHLRTCGFLLKNMPIVKQLFIDKIGFSEEEYKKYGDFTSYLNDHKHQLQKKIKLMDVLEMMQCYHRLIDKYCSFIGLNVNADFNGEEYASLFGKTEKEKIEMESQIEIEKRISREKTEIVNAFTQKSVNNTNSINNVNSVNNANAKNNIYTKHELDRFITNAKKEYVWMGTKKDYQKVKKRLLYICLATIIVGVLSTIISSIAFKIYCTFTLFENIWLIMCIVTATSVYRQNKKMLDFEYASLSWEKFVVDQTKSFLSTSVEKKKFIVFRILSYTAVVLNIICLWIMSSGILAGFATALEVAFFVLSIVFHHFYKDYSLMYCQILISGKNYNGETIEFVRVYGKGIYTKEAYLKSVPENYLD